MKEQGHITAIWGRGLVLSSSQAICAQLQVACLDFQAHACANTVSFTAIWAALLSAAHQGRAPNSLLLPLGQHDASDQQHQKL